MPANPNKPEGKKTAPLVYKGKRIPPPPPLFPNLFSGKHIRDFDKEGVFSNYIVNLHKNELIAPSAVNPRRTKNRVEQRLRKMELEEIGVIDDDNNLRSINSDILRLRDELDSVIPVLLDETKYNEREKAMLFLGALQNTIDSIQGKTRDDNKFKTRLQQIQVDVGIMVGFIKPQKTAVLRQPDAKIQRGSEPNMRHDDDSKPNVPEPIKKGTAAYYRVHKSDPAVLKAAKEAYLRYDRERSAPKKRLI